MLQNAYFLAKIGADTAENGPHFVNHFKFSKCCQNCLHAFVASLLEYTSATFSAAGLEVGRRADTAGSPERGATPWTLSDLSLDVGISMRSWNSVTDTDSPFYSNWIPRPGRHMEMYAIRLWHVSSFARIRSPKWMDNICRRKLDEENLFMFISVRSFDDPRCSLYCAAIFDSFFEQFQLYGRRGA